MILKDRRALVTGWGSGIGKAISLAFAAAGADVAGFDVDEAASEATTSEVRQLGRSALGLRCDVSEPTAVADAMATLESSFGIPDILVNNAVMVYNARPEVYPVDRFRATLAVNVLGAFLCIQEVGRRLIERSMPGSIINISSITATSAMGRGNFAYSASKAALIQMTKELAVEWGPHGIRINTIQPGWTTTPRHAGLVANESTAALLSRAVPLGRFNTPDDVAHAALFLASDQAATITGTVLVVDGGNLALNAGGTVGPQ